MFNTTTLQAGDRVRPKATNWTPEHIGTVVELTTYINRISGDYFTRAKVVWDWSGEEQEMYADELERYHEKKHGGAREGAGRPPLDAAEPTVAVTVTLTKSLDDKAVRIGNGNRSEGIRKALEAYEEAGE